MAIKLSDFEKATYKARGKKVEIPYLYQSIKKDKIKGYKFIGRFSYEGKIYTKVLGYSEKDKLTPKKAEDLIKAYKKDIEDGYTPTGAINLNRLHDLYFESEKDTTWNRKKKSYYVLYIKNTLGKKSIETIKEMHIKKIITSMENKGLKERTQKAVLEVLKPMFNMAVRNKMLKENPAQNINITIPSQKKIVVGATELFREVFNGINEYYHDNPFYKALFLFGFTGRRKSEILNLKWSNIDFKNNYYWIEDTKNKDKQKYELPSYLIDPLQSIRDNRRGLVFKSPISYTEEQIEQRKERNESIDPNFKPLTNIDRQMRQLKKFIGINNLSLHYMRNILVSALAESGTESITLSGVLGHKDPNTITKYLSINHHSSSKKGLEKVDSILDVEIIEDRKPTKEELQKQIEALQKQMSEL